MFSPLTTHAQLEISASIANRTDYEHFPPNTINPDLVESPNQFASSAITNGGNEAVGVDPNLEFPEFIPTDPITGEVIAGRGVRLVRSLIGSSFSTQPPQLFIGDVIPLPLVDSDGNEVDPDSYWRREPLRPGELLDDGSAPDPPVDANFQERYYWSPHAERVFATEPGTVDIYWRSRRLIDTTGDQMEDSFDVVMQTHQVSAATTQPVRTVFWTETLEGFNGPLIDIPQGRVQEVNIIYNFLIPQYVDENENGNELAANSPILEDVQDFEFDQYRTIWFSTIDRKIHAHNKTGRVVELSRCAALNRSAKSIDFRKQSCFRMLMVLLNEIEIEMFCFQKLILGDYSLSTH